MMAILLIKRSIEDAASFWTIIGIAIEKLVWAKCGGYSLKGLFEWADLPTALFSLLILLVSTSAYRACIAPNFMSKLFLIRKL